DQIVRGPAEGSVVAAQLNRVRAMVAVDKAASGSGKAVGAGAAEDGSSAIDDRIVAVVAVDQVRRAADEHRVIAGAPEHGSAVAEENRVVALIAIDQAGATGADKEHIVPRAADDGHVGPAILNGIVALIAFDEVRPKAGVDAVVALAAGDGVVR